MDARLLLILFDAAYLIATAAWVGGLMFWWFRRSGRDADAPDSASAWYSWGMNWSAVALASLVCGRLTHQEYRGASVLLQAAPLVAVVLSMVHGSQSLCPALASALAAGPSGTERLKRLRRQQGVLDALNLIIGLALLIAFAARPAPQTPGVVEPTPLQRAVIEQEALLKRDGPARSRDSLESQAGEPPRPSP